MQFKIICKIITVLLFPAFLSAQLNFEKDFFNNYPRETVGENLEVLQSPHTGNYDVIYCKLELQADPAEYFIDGTATTKFKPTTDDFQTMYMDFSNQIEVQEVRFEGGMLSYEQLDGDELRIDFPGILAPDEPREVIIKYAGQPASSGFGSFAIGNQCGEQAIPSMWTLSEPYGAKHWWPCKQTLNDKYDSIDVVITTPERYRAASNGLLVNEEQNGDKKTYTWSHRYPIPAYLVAFAISEYEVYSDWVPISNTDQLEVLNYVFPCNLDYAKSRTPYTVPVMQFFREKFGEYPYIQEKYGHCNFGWGGGMEHSTMSFMGGFSNLLIAHELAHQWFGDKITCGSWQDIWLNEGFATYLEGLTYDFGVDPAGWENWKDKNLNRATSDPTRSVWVDDTTSVNRIFNGNLSYSKGAYLLHMLRWMMGDEDFFQALNNYIHDPELAYGYARSWDLQRHLENTSGMDLEEFFNDWLYGGGYPVYEVIWEQTNSKTVVAINQTPTNPQSVDFFNMPVPLYLYGNGQDTTVVLDPAYSGQLFELDIPFVISGLIFDPEKWICAQNAVTTNVQGLLHNGFRVFPNPASQYIRISGISGKNVNVKLLDQLGRVVKTLEQSYLTDQDLEIDLLGLNPGIYRLMVESGSNHYTNNIVLE